MHFTRCWGWRWSSAHGARGRSRRNGSPTNAQAPLAAAVYGYAPYTLFNIFARGAAPEQLAVALLPWLLWSLSRALRLPTAPALVRLALLYAALLLTHNLNAFVGTAMLVVWAMAEAVGRLRFEGGRMTGLQPAHLSLSALALIVGLLLSAFFWLPVFAEAGAVQLTQLTAPATLDFRNYFLTPEQLLTTTFAFDPRLEPPTFPVAFGLPPLILAALRWFYFPSWQAEVDGQPAPIRAAEPFGFITAAVPAGAHTVRVFFGDTPLRRLAAALSLLGCIGLPALVVFARSAGAASLRPAPRALPSAFYVLFLTLFLLRVSLEHFDSPWRRSRFDGQAVSGAAQTLDLNFGDRLRLIGFDPPAPTPADQPLTFTLYWTLFGPADADYSIAAQLWDTEGHTVSQQDSQHPNGAPTTRWLAGNYAADAHMLRPYPGTPAGEYRLMVGVYAADKPSLEVRDASGLLLGRFYEAARVTVLPPTRPPSEAELAPAQRLRAPLGPLELIGVDGLRPQVTAGDELPLVLYWRNAGAAGDWRLELALAGERRIPLNGLPVAAGRVVRWPHTLRIPPEANGPADLQVSLLDSGGRRLAGPVTLGRMEVGAPLRSLDLPDIPAPLNARFGAGMELLGYGLSAATLTPGRALEVTLFWRAQERMVTRYAVSVQLLNAQGQIVAQADGEPGQGARPTTGWLPPEIITDPRVLALPADMAPGAYVLQAVVYDPRTGARLPTTGPSDALALRTFELLP